MTFEWFAFLPIWAVKLGVVLILLAILLWMRFFPRSYILREAPDNRWWRDIRWWAAGIFVLLVLTTVVL